MSSSRREVAATTLGPSARRASIAARASASVVTGQPVSRSSSKALGVAIDAAAGDGAIAEEFGDPRGDVGAAIDVADHRIAGVSRVRIGGADAREGAERRLADLLLAEIAGDQADATRQNPINSSPPMHSSIMPASKARPRQPGCPVWLENCTLISGQTSRPSRCNGKTAAELPTWP